MTKLHVPSLALAFAAALLLAGCGDDEPAPPAGSGGEPAAFEPPAETVVNVVTLEVDAETGFAASAFPPVMPKAAWHESTWTAEACLECHATGEEDAPVPKHEGLPALAAQVACRSCHVMVADE